MRIDLAAIQPEIQHAPQRSTINLFKLLNQRTAPTLADFLHEAAALPAGVTFDTDTPEPPDTQPNPNGLCGVNGSQATTLLFNPTRPPSSTPACRSRCSPTRQQIHRYPATSASRSRNLPGRAPYCSIARKSQTACRPSSSAAIPHGSNGSMATTPPPAPSDRRAAGLLALMRFPSNAPLVRAGSSVKKASPVLSEYRDNWWSAGARIPDPPLAIPAAAATFFTQPPDPSVSRPALPCRGDRANADREIASLRATPCSSDYFAPPRSIGRSSIQLTRAPAPSSAGPSAPSARDAGQVHGGPQPSPLRHRADEISKERVGKALYELGVICRGVVLAFQGPNPQRRSRDRKRSCWRSGSHLASMGRNTR